MKIPTERVGYEDGTASWFLNIDDFKETGSTNILMTVHNSDRVWLHFYKEDFRQLASILQEAQSMA